MHVACLNLDLYNRYALTCQFSGFRRYFVLLVIWECITTYVNAES